LVRSIISRPIIERHGLVGGAGGAGGLDRIAISNVDVGCAWWEGSVVVEEDGEEKGEVEEGGRNIQVDPGVGDATVGVAEHVEVAALTLLQLAPLAQMVAALVLQAALLEAVVVM